MLAKLVRIWVHKRTQVPPDEVIGKKYIRRWFLLKPRSWITVYLHEFLADDDRFLHDHPKDSLSIVLQGAYWECFANSRFALRKVGAVVFRKATTMHRIELYNAGSPVYMIFIMWGKSRDWGLQFPDGWVSNKVCTDRDETGLRTLKPEYRQRLFRE